MTPVSVPASIFVSVVVVLLLLLLVVLVVVVVAEEERPRGGFHDGLCDDSKSLRGG